MVYYGEKYGDGEITSELAMVIGAITELENIIGQAEKQEVENMSMCEALQELEQRGVERGIAQEKKAIILQMLKKGMNKDLIKEITGADDALIDELS